MPDKDASLDKPANLQTDELASGIRYVEYLKGLPSFVEAERELRGKSERELRAMVLAQLSAFKQRQMTAKDRAEPGSDPEGWDRYSEWSRYEDVNG